MDEHQDKSIDSINEPTLTPALGSLFEFLRTIVFVLIVAFLIRHFLIQPFVVDGSSMEPNFHNAEYILVDKLDYRLHSPTRGDVIVFHPPGSTDNFIKRIIGLPGDTVQTQGRHVLVNGVALSEAYINLPDVPDSQVDTTEPINEVTLATNQYFVMGDNRDHSKDSRELGPITRDRFIGRAWVILFPFKNASLVGRPAYTNLSASIEQKFQNIAHYFV